MEIEMKAMIAALALVLLAAGPTFAAGSHTRHLQEGRASAYVPQFGSYGVTDTSREGMIHAN
jgi:hypothetical protein